MSVSKTRFVFLLILLLLCSIAGLFACNKQDDATVLSVSVNFPDIVTVGEQFPEDTKAVVVFSNGNRSILSLSQVQISGLDVNREGVQEITVTYGGVSYTGKVNFVRYFNVRYVVDGEGGTLSGELDQTGIRGESLSIVKAIPYEGYEFDSWSDGYPTSIRYDDKAVENVTYTAKFKRTTYQISFYRFDYATRSFVDPEIQIVDYGASLTVPELQQNEIGGYSFLGYVTGQSQAGLKQQAAIGNNVIKQGAQLSPKDNARYYPVYVPRTYVARYYDVTTGRQLLNVRDIQYDKAVNVYQKCVELVESSLGLYPDYYDISFSATSGDSVSAIDEMHQTIVSKGDIRIDINYEFVKVKVRYLDNGVVIAETNESNSPRYADSIDVFDYIRVLLGLDADYSQTGYTDLRWENDGQIYSSDPSSQDAVREYMIGTVGVVDFHLQKTLRKFDLTFVDTSDESTQVIQLDYQTDIAPNMVSAPVHSDRDDLLFRGWYADAECTTEFNPRVKISDDVTVYAAWYVAVTLYFENCSMEYKYVASDYKVIAKDRLTVYVYLYDDLLGESGRYEFFVPESDRTDTMLACYCDQLLPTRQKYEFLKWNADKQLTTPYDFESAISTGTSLYSELIVERFNLYVDLTIGTLYVGCGNSAHTQYTSETVYTSPEGGKVIFNRCAACQRLVLVTNEYGKADLSSGWVHFKVPRSMSGNSAADSVKFTYYEEFGYEQSLLRLGPSTSNINSNTRLTTLPTSTVEVDGATCSVYEVSRTLSDEDINAANNNTALLTVLTKRRTLTVNLSGSNNTSAFTVDGAEPEEDKLVSSSATQQTLTTYYGQSVTLSLTPKKGYKFTAVTVRENINNYSTQNETYKQFDDPEAMLTIDLGGLTKNYIITVYTEKVYYTITAIATGKGDIQAKKIENDEVSTIDDESTVMGYSDEKGYAFAISQEGNNAGDVIAAIKLDGEYIYTSARGEIKTAANYAYVKKLNWIFATQDLKNYLKGDIILTNVDKNMTLEIIYAKASVKLSISMDLTKGSYSGFVLNGETQRIKLGENIEVSKVDYAATLGLTVTAIDGYMVEKVRINDVDYDVSKKSFSDFPAYLTEDNVIVITFTEQVYTIDVSVSAGGSVRLYYGGVQKVLPFQYKYGDTTDIRLDFIADDAAGKVIGSLAMNDNDYDQYFEEKFASIDIPARTKGSLNNYADYYLNATFVNRKQTITVRLSRTDGLKDIGYASVNGEEIRITEGNSVEAKIKVQYGQNTSFKTFFTSGAYDGGIYATRFAKYTGAEPSPREDFVLTDADEIAERFSSNEYKLNNVRDDIIIELSVDLARYTLTYASIENLDVVILDAKNVIIPSGSSLLYGTPFRIRITPSAEYDLRTATLAHEKVPDEAVSSFTRTQNDDTGIIESILSDDWRIIDTTTLVVTAQLATFDFSYENHKIYDEVIGRITDMSQQGVATATFDTRQTAGNLLRFKVTLESNYLNKYNISVVVNKGEEGEYTLTPETTGENEGYYVLAITRNTKVDVNYNPINIIITTEIHGMPTGCHVQINTTNYNADTIKPDTKLSLAMTDVTVIIKVDNEMVKEVRVVIVSGDAQDTLKFTGVSGNKYVSHDLLKSVTDNVSISIYFF